MTEDLKRFLMILAITGYSLINIAIFGIHIYIVYYAPFGYAEGDLILYINATVAIIVSILLIIAGYNLIKKIRIVYSGIIGNKIIHRVKFIISCSGVIYLVKCILCIVIENASNNLNSTDVNIVFILLYLAGSEIFPLCSVLFFLKPTLLKNNDSVCSYLPSGLLSYPSSSSKLNSTFFAFMEESQFFDEYQTLGKDKRSKSTPSMRPPKLGMVNQNNTYRTLIIN